MKNKLTDYLRFVGNKFGINGVSIAKDSFWIVIEKIIVTLSAFVLVVIMSNSLSPETYGQYKFVLSIFGVITAFSLTGIGTSITQAVASGQKNILTSAVKTHLKWGLIMTFISIIVSAYYFVMGNFQLCISMLIISVFAPVVQALPIYNSYLQGKKFFKESAKISALYNLFPTIILAIISLTTNNFVILILAFFSSYTIMAAIFFIKIRKIDKNEGIVETNNINHNSIITYGKHLSLMNILGGITFNLDKILIFHYLGAIQVATYTIAMAAPKQIRQLNKILALLSLPRLSKMDPATIKEILPRKIFIISIGTILITILYILLAPFLYNLFFPKYPDAIFYSRLYSLIIMTLPMVLINQVLISQFVKKELYILQTVSPLSKILFLLILLPKFGIIGAILSILFSEIIKNILLINSYLKIMKSRS